MQRSLRFFFTLIFFSHVLVCAATIPLKDAHAKRLVLSGCLVAAMAAVDIALQSDYDVIEASHSALDTRPTFEKWCDRVDAVCTLKNWKTLIKEVADVLWPKEDEKRWLPVRTFRWAKNHVLLTAAVALSMVNAGASVYQIYVQSAPALLPIDSTADVKVAPEAKPLVVQGASGKKMLHQKIKRKIRISDKYPALRTQRKWRRKQQQRLEKMVEVARPVGSFSSQSMGRKPSLCDGGYVMPDDMLDGIVRPWSANGREKHLIIPSSQQLLQRSGSPWILEVAPRDGGYSSDDESDSELVSFEATPNSGIQVPTPQRFVSVVESPLTTLKPVAVPVKPLQVRAFGRHNIQVGLEKQNTWHVPPRPPATRPRARVSTENVPPSGIGIATRAQFPAFGSTARRFSSSAVVF